jgi:hypothetical protein
MGGAEVEQLSMGIVQLSTAGLKGAPPLLQVPPFVRLSHGIAGSAMLRSRWYKRACAIGTALFCF